MNKMNIEMEMGILLADAMGFGIDKAAQRMEESHQQNTICSRELPIRGSNELLKLGFQLGDATDNLFRKVIWPKGWNLKATDHSMWSNIIDDKDRQRVQMFYKGAFWDRDAFLCQPNRRFNVNPYNTKKDCDFDNKQWIAQVQDYGLVYEPKCYNLNSKLMTYDEAREFVVIWLNENRPQWEDFMTYWDDTSANIVL